MKIDVRDKEIVIDGSVITFPASYDKHGRRQSDIWQYSSSVGRRR